jgi:hypothetical protein
MDPASEMEARKEFSAKGYVVVGWYHSHPTFEPNPSIRDIENQSAYQGLFRRMEDGIEPFIGVIVNPYPRAGGGEDATTTTTTTRTMESCQHHEQHSSNPSSSSSSSSYAPPPLPSSSAAVENDKPHISSSPHRMLESNITYLSISPEWSANREYRKRNVPETYALILNYYCFLFRYSLRLHGRTSSQTDSFKGLVCAIE